MFPQWRMLKEIKCAEPNRKILLLADKMIFSVFSLKEVGNRGGGVKKLQNDSSVRGGGG